MLIPPIRGNFLRNVDSFNGSNGERTRVETRTSLADYGWMTKEPKERVQGHVHGRGANKWEWVVHLDGKRFAGAQVTGARAKAETAMRAAEQRAIDSLDDE